jgi:hypothetical protein
MKRLLLVLTFVLAAAPAFAQLNPSAPAPVREPKDAGRTLVTINADAVTPAASDTLVTVAKLVGDTVTAGVTTYPVSSGKTLRLQTMTLSLVSSTTTINKVRVRLRTLVSGACIATSPLVATYEIGWMTPTTPVANAPGNSITISFPDGMEFSGATRNICLSAIGAAANGTLSIA